MEWRKGCRWNCGMAVAGMVEWPFLHSSISEFSLAFPPFLSPRARSALLPALQRCCFGPSLPGCACAAASRFCSISAQSSAWRCCACPAGLGQGDIFFSSCSCLLWCRVAARTKGQSELLLLCSCPFS